MPLANPIGCYTNLRTYVMIHMIILTKVYLVRLLLLWCLVEFVTLHRVFNVVGPRAEVFTGDAGCSFLAVLTGGWWFLNSFKYCRNIASGKGCMVFNPVDNCMCNIWLHSNSPV